MQLVPRPKSLRDFASRRSIEILIALVILWLSVGPLRMVPAATLNIYSVGNSLTVDLRASGGVESLSSAEGRPVVQDYHVRCGSSLSGIVANITQTCVAPLAFGSLTDAFAYHATTTIDAVTLQPFYSATIRQEVAAARTIIDTIRGSEAGRDARILVYATWPSQSDGPVHETWASEDASLDSPFRPSRKSYELFLDAVREFEPSASLIPAGHAWVAIAEASETTGTFAGVNGVADLYRDDIHASNLGRYIAGLATYSSIFGESTNPSTFPWQYSLNGFGTAPHPTDLPALQDLTWQTVQAVPEPESWLPAIIIVAGGVTAGLRASGGRRRIVASPSLAAACPNRAPGAIGR